MNDCVADSHNLFRRRLTRLISAEADMEVLGEASMAANALALVNSLTSEGDRLTPAVHLLSMEIGLARNNPEIVRSPRLLSGATWVLSLDAQESAECLDITVAAGASGYILKSAGQPG